jgi:hypothetical protein
MRKFMPACFVKPLFPPRIELWILRDNIDTMETRMPKDLRGWLIHSLMWTFYVGENYLIDHAKSLCRSIYFLNN